MMEDEVFSPDTVNRNIGYLFIAEAVTKLLSFCSFVLLARALAVEQYGVIALAFSIGSLFYIFFNLGLDYHLIRDIKQARLSLGDIFSAVSNIKIWGVPVFLVVFFIAYWVMKWPWSYFFVILLVFGHFYLVSALTILFFIFRAFEKLKYELVTRLCHAVGLLTCTILFGCVQKNLLLLSLGYLGISAVVLFAFFIFTAKTLNVPVGFSPSSLRRELAMIGRSRYLFLTNVCTSIFSGVDVLIISSVLGLQAVAVYKNAVLITISLFMLPTVVMQAFFPRLVQYSFESAYFWREIGRILRKTVAFAVFIVAVFYFLAPLLIPFVFGDRYATSIPLFRASLPVFVLACIATAFGYGMMATGEYKMYFAITLVVSVFAVLSNLFLIPILGLTGCVITLNGNYLLLTTLPLVALLYKRKWGIMFGRGRNKPEVVKNLVQDVASVMIEGGSK